MKAFLRRLSARNGEHCGSESPEHWLQRMRLDSSRWFSTSLKSEANEVTHLVLLAVFSSGTSPWTIVGATIVAAGIRAVTPAQIALRVGSAAPLLHEAGRFCIATALWLALAVLFGLGAHRCVCFLALSLSLFLSLSLTPTSSTLRRHRRCRSVVEPVTIMWAMLQAVLTLPSLNTTNMGVIFPQDLPPGTSLKRRAAQCMLGELYPDWHHDASENSYEIASVRWNERGEGLRCCRCVGAALGAWIGALPIPLDWHAAWQVWPVSCVWGGALGAALGIFFGAVARRLGPWAKRRWCSAGAGGRRRRRRAAE